MEVLVPRADEWITVGRPGFQDKDRDAQTAGWNDQYGEGNWRIAWELRDGRVLDFEGVFRSVYIPGYVRHFQVWEGEARYITERYSYAYDKDLITREQAFDPHALYNKPDRPNQFHHVAINIALEDYLGIPFKGEEPVQVRLGKKWDRKWDWPAGYHWSPGSISAVRKDLIPHNTGLYGWWEPNSIEDFYQKTKVLQVR